MQRAVEVSAHLTGTREELYSILADISHYARWVPGLELSRILAREGDITIVELRGSRFGDHTFNFELIRSLPKAIVFRQIDSLDGPDISGKWSVGETEPGPGSARTLVRLQAQVDTPLLELGSRRRIRSALRAGLDALEIRRRHLGSARPAARAGRQKVLEVVREADGLRVWYLGESFRMPKEDAGC